MIATLPKRLPWGVFLASVEAGTLAFRNTGTPLKVEAWWALTAAHALLPAAPFFRGTHSGTAGGAGGHAV